jgi:VIT1/CCC1 family predicted Fe2+/Mn2+ transporter
MRPEAPERPASGLGHYLRDIVNGSLDGVITTLAVISGASGAQLEPRIGLILGMANLVADGLSMGASNYLGLKSELIQTGKSRALEMPWRHGVATTIAFALFGAVPLLAYLVAVPTHNPEIVFEVALALSLVALAVLGQLRSRYLRSSPLRSAAEVIVIGLSASGAAYGIGAAAQRLI